MTFIHDDFMLNNETAKHLYHSYAKDMPIFDYHCHLIPEWIANDHEFADITEIWLAGDHYKWRAMRANGVPEEKITGNASSEEKFEAWAETAEATIGNPLYHWSHLELKRYFGIDDLLSKDNWKEIYDRANEVIKTEKLTARKLIEMSNVKFVGTTDNPTDSLEYHAQMSADDSYDVVVAPSFRPDEAFHIEDERFTEFLDRMEKIFGSRISTYSDLITQLEERVNFFDDHGAVSSDHALETFVYTEATDAEIEAIFQKAVNQEEISVEDKEKYLTRILVDLSEMYADRGWVMQIHYGAIRNNNNYWYEKLGADVGFDSIGDSSSNGKKMNQLLSAMEQKQKMPKLIIYNLDPTQNYIVASTAANFQVNDEGIKSKVQFGACWWFNDTELGMLRQMETLADHGLLMNFVGMLTDSRSLVSYPRHEYFRRILCQFVGENVELGKFPNDEKLLERLIKNICYDNAVAFFK